ncbi:hypothetical protein MKZ21_30755 [Paenibacillus sp. FSL P2-0536]|uniref:hypothetical protein n=1 Tax=Paenibacillus sp. FSL P2-0536 TaxID=2921629 RepID=UPI0030F7D94F
MELKSNYQIYKELVYAVVEHALGVRNIVDAIEKTLFYDTFTRTEILNISCVQMEAYVSDCTALYIKELEHRLSGVEYQLSRIIEKLKSDGIELFEGPRSILNSTKALIKMNEHENLIVIRIIDHSAGDEALSYAIIASDVEKAGNLALQIHAKEHETEVNHLEIDSDSSFEISCAPDAHGELFYINLTKKITKEAC